MPRRFEKLPIDPSLVSTTPRLRIGHHFSGATLGVISTSLTGGSAYMLYNVLTVPGSFSEGAGVVLGAAGYAAAAFIGITALVHDMQDSPHAVKTPKPSAAWGVQP